MMAKITAITGAWRARMVRHPRIACFALGVLTACALPPIHGLPLVFLTIPALLFLAGEAQTAPQAGWRGWWFGFGFHLLGLYWITEAVLVEAARLWWLVPFTVPAVAAVLAVFIAIPAWISRWQPAGLRRVLTFAATWTMFDLARQFVLTGFPWNPLGSVWEFPNGMGDVMIQSAAWVGIHGLTLLTLLVTTLPLLGRQGVVVGGVILLAWASVGAARLQQPEPVRPDLTVVMVQGNIPQGEKWTRERILDGFRRHIALTREGIAAAGSGPAVVVWSETAVPFLLEPEQGAREAISAAAGENPVLLGGIRIGPDDRARNSLFALEADGLIASVYDKAHLVPFGEYQPSWADIGIPIMPGSGFVAGPGPRSLHPPGVPPFGALICYEAIFPGQVIDPQDRPSWLVNVTNDAWFGNSTGPRQHLAAARMRAVEEGLPLVRVANTGISAAFDAWGRELIRFGMNQAGVITVRLPGALPPTFFAAHGLWVPFGMSVVLLVAAAAGSRRGS